MGIVVLLVPYTNLKPSLINTLISRTRAAIWTKCQSLVLFLGKYNFLNLQLDSSYIFCVMMSSFLCMVLKEIMCCWSDFVALIYCFSALIVISPFSLHFTLCTLWTKECNQNSHRWSTLILEFLLQILTGDISSKENRIKYALANKVVSKYLVELVCGSSRKVF